MHKMIQHTLNETIKIDKAEHHSLPELIRNLKLKILETTPTQLRFDLINCDCSIANALRRIMTAEVPTVAIESVSITENTGAIPDESLAHRLGLIPVLKTVEEFDEKNKKLVLCVKNVKKEICAIYSDDVEPKNVLKKNVLITRLGPNQAINLEMSLAVGKGADHAKFSPVCPATYRLMPKIEIDDFYGEEARELKQMFGEGVIEIENGKAVVKNCRNDFMSREALRWDKFKNRVWIGRVANHFIFDVETVVLNPILVLRKAIEILKTKAEDLKSDILKKDD